MNQIQLAWSAWYGDKKIDLDIPDTWQVDYYDMPSEKRVSDDDLRQSLLKMDSSLTEKKPANAVIVVDDLTRPVKLERLMPLVLNRLNTAGIGDESIKILIGLGSHAGLSRENLIKKLGEETVNRVKCINHDPNDTVDIDLIWGKTPVKLNRHYVEAAFKIVISGLTPHSFAGFSGGAKMLYPGLADMETISKTHKSVLMGFMGKLGDVEKNKFRRIIEEFVEKVGLDYFFGVVINSDRSIRSIHGGHYIEAHRTAALEAADYCRVTLKRDNYDIVVSSAYPKDSELLQAENGFIPIKSAGSRLLREGGIFILTSACSEGIGHHGLFGPQGTLYRKPRPLRFLKGRQLWALCSNITPKEFHLLYAEDYKTFADWKEIINEVENQKTGQLSVAVFPYGSMQMVQADVN